VSSRVCTPTGDASRGRTGESHTRVAPPSAAPPPAAHPARDCGAPHAPPTAADPTPTGVEAPSAGSAAVAGAEPAGVLPAEPAAGVGPPEPAAGRGGGSAREITAARSVSSCRDREYSEVSSVSMSHTRATAAAYGMDEGGRLMPTTLVRSGPSRIPPRAQPG
jgi:hypothetical protein